MAANAWLAPPPKRSRRRREVETDASEDGRIADEPPSPSPQWRHWSFSGDRNQRWRPVSEEKRVALLSLRQALRSPGCRGVCAGRSVMRRELQRGVSAPEVQLPPGQTTRCICSTCGEAAEVPIITYQVSHLNFTRHSPTKKFTYLAKFRPEEEGPSCK